jgi:hypothetical protein
MALCNEIEAPICFNYEIIRSIEKQKFTIGIFFSHQAGPVARPLRPSPKAPN